MRAFIAVELPEALRREVAALQDTLKATGADVKWVEPANLHLTLKFLGDIAEIRVTPITEALRTATRHVASFTMRLAGVGAFPSTRSPRVVWVGVKDGQAPLRELAEAVEQACAGAGFPTEGRPFSPHLTIGRVRSQNRVAGLVKQLQVAAFQGTAPAPVGRLTLVQSTLSPRGPTYTPLADIPLG